MKLYILGSCSGTEPKENRHHTSVVLEINGRLCFFDAGETCSYTAHLMGINLLKVSDIFISHPHIDHVGGLGNLLWCIKKLTVVNKELPHYKDVTVHISEPEIFDCVIGMLRGTDANFTSAYKTSSHKISDGLVMKNDDLEVSAIHNLHIPEKESGFASYSFCIKAEGKKVIYSGDVKDFGELSEFLKDGADVLLMETGHHSAIDVCQRIKDGKMNIGKVIFMHHGREILYNYDGVLKACREILPNVVICNDKDCFEF